jgi:hypothetical protein
LLFSTSVVKKPWFRTEYYYMLKPEADYYKLLKKPKQTKTKNTEKTYHVNEPLTFTASSD